MAVVLFLAAVGELDERVGKVHVAQIHQRLAEEVQVWNLGPGGGRGGVVGEGPHRGEVVVAVARVLPGVQASPAVNAETNNDILVLLIFVP